MEEKVKLYNYLHEHLDRFIENVKKDYDFPALRLREHRNVIIAFIARVDQEQHITQLNQIDPGLVDFRFFKILHQKYPELNKMSKQVVLNRLIPYLKSIGLGM